MIVSKIVKAISILIKLYYQSLERPQYYVTSLMIHVSDGDGLIPQNLTSIFYNTFFEYLSSE